MPRLTRLVAMTASAIAPGSRKSTGRPAGVGRTPADAKKSRTTAGMTMVTRTFSPRRAVRRSSVTVWAKVAASGEAGRLTGAPCVRDCRVVDGPPAAAPVVGLPAAASPPTRSRYASSSVAPTARSSTIRRSGAGAPARRAPR